MIHRVTPLPALLAAAAIAVACGNPRPATETATPASSPATATDSTAAPPAARGPTPAQSPQAAALEGSWSLRTVEPNRRGPRLQLHIDSASGSTFRVRVAFLMQGDVGLDPTRFTPTRGEIGADGVVHLTIQRTDRAEPSGELFGTLAGDTIHLRRYQWGGADQAAGGVHWLLVREP
jgi:hypothetical protein